MGGPVARAIAIPFTMGLSELGQKKPFQNFKDDQPIGPLSGSAARFIPIAGQATSAVDVGMKAMSPDISIPEPPKALEAADKPVQDAVAEGAQRRSRARGYRSTILSQMAPKNMRETFGG